MSALTERHAERVRALLAGPGDDITVRRASRALGCSDSQARAAIVLLAEQGALRQVNSASGVEMWEQVEPPTAEDYAEAGLPGLAPMPTLTERLAEAVSSPALGAQANEARTDRAVRAVAGWLRARDNEHGDNRLAELADLIERGEA